MHPAASSHSQDHARHRQHWQTCTQHWAPAGKASNCAVPQLLVGCLMSQQHASVSQGWTRSDNCTCRHNEIRVADQIFFLTQSQSTDTGPTSHTEIEVADQICYISLSRSIRTPGQPVPLLALLLKAPGRVATGLPMFKSLV